MAKYFGHQPAWKQGSGSFNFGGHEFSPPAPTKNKPPSPGRNAGSGGYGGSGLKRLVPSGSPGGPARAPNVPYLGTPRSPITPYGQAAKLAKAALFGRGISGPLGLGLDLFTAATGWDPWGFMNPGQSAHYDMTGWVHKFGEEFHCGPAEFRWWRFQLGTMDTPSAYECLPGQVPGGPFGTPITHEYVNTRFAANLFFGQGSDIRMVFDEGWNRPLLPVGQQYPPMPFIPATAPKTPYPFPRTSAPPLSQTKEKNYPRNPQPKPKAPPYVSPAPTLVIGGKNPHVPAVPVMEDHPHLPPPPRTKEKKGTLGGTGAAGRIYGGLTEIGDAADAVADAIPGKPCKGLGFQQKLICIYQHAGDIDVAQAAKNLAADQLEDAVVGKLNQLANQIAKNEHWVRPVGPGAGSWGRRF